MKRPLLDESSILGSYDESLVGYLKDFIRKFVRELNGCNTKKTQPYRIIDFSSSEPFSYGLSSTTALNYPELGCGETCPEYPENSRSFECVECSSQIAAADLEALEMFKYNITEAAKAKCFNAALLAGFISRQTRGGKLLDGTNGWIPCNNKANGNCFGIMHMNDISMFRPT